MYRHNIFICILAIILTASILAFSGCGTSSGVYSANRAVSEMSEKSETSDISEKDEDDPFEVEVDLNKIALSCSSSSISYNVEKNSDTVSKENSSVSLENSKKAAYKPIKVNTGSAVELSWFDDCVFLGDSFTNGLGLYNDTYGELGNAQFVCAACIGWVSSQYGLDEPNTFHPTYNGQTVFLYNAPALTGANKVIITLGMNDIGCFGIEGTLEAADSFISKVRETAPNVKIYITTVTPMVASAEYDLLNNSLIQSFNEKLPEFAREHNCAFLDTWSVFADENGKLPEEYCIDPYGLGFHLNNDGNHLLCEFYKDNLG